MKISLSKKLTVAEQRFVRSLTVWGVVLRENDSEKEIALVSSLKFITQGRVKIVVFKILLELEWDDLSSDLCRQSIQYLQPWFSDL